MRFLHSSLYQFIISVFQCMGTWGRMNASGMLAHLNDSYRMALGDLPVPAEEHAAPISLVKQLIVYVLPFPKNAPTAPELIARCDARGARRRTTSLRGIARATGNVTPRRGLPITRPLAASRRAPTACSWPGTPTITFGSSDCDLSCSSCLLTVIDGMANPAPNPIVGLVAGTAPCLIEGGSPLPLPWQDLPAPLTGAELLDVRDALIDALLDPAALDEVTLRLFNKPLNFIAGPANYPTQALAIVRHAKAQNQVEQLIAAALLVAPRNRLLLAMAERVGADDGRGQFERIIKPHLGIQNAAQWQTRLVCAMNAVCRVEVDGEGIGTGFLVGPSQLLTNYHVRHEKCIAPAPHGMTFRFDYHNVNGQPSQGVVHPPAQQAVLAESPCQALDYALIALAKPAGNERVNNFAHADRRGWMVPKWTKRRRTIR